MIHQLTASVVQLHQRLGDAGLGRRLRQYSVGESVAALEELQARYCGSVSAGARTAANLLAEGGVSLITELDIEYPVWLRGLGSEAPPFLYVTGCIERLRARSIAIIGMRQPTADGRAAATIMGRAAAEHGWVVVSGNAPGVDCAGHSAALAVAEGATLVFPPVSMDQYKALFRNNDAERVTVAAGFVPGSAVEPWMFLRRNSLVAAQCRAGFVAETGVRGGTLDTVKKLIARRRPTFATKLPPDGPHVRAHEMLAAGAVELVDILNAPEAATGAILDAAQNARVAARVQTAVLGDFFDMENPA